MSHLINPDGTKTTGGVVVSRAGRVVEQDDPALPYVLLDAAGVEVREVSEYLRHVVACDFSPASVESYARALLRWLRYLWAIEMPWEQVRRDNVREFVLWMRSSASRRPSQADAPAHGSLNPRTGKRYLGATFAPATINHNLAVVSSFYRYQLEEQGRGPVVNPVPVRVSGRAGRRQNAHHNPLEPFPRGRRAAYRQRVPRAAPRAIPDSLFDELFTALPSDRDRALVAMYVSTGARPAELLGVTSEHVDYGEQMVAVIRKGTRELQWLPASPDAFVWLRLYQQTLPLDLLGPDQPVWWTLRRPWRRLDYEAMRAVLRRINRQLGTNWTLHDLRHTAAIRMASDPKMPLISLQTLLGHTYLTTTQQYLAPYLDQIVAHVRQHHRDRSAPVVPPHGGPTLSYDDADMKVLFGWQSGPGVEP